jgi:hypothetical protein
LLIHQVSRIQPPLPLPVHPFPLAIPTSISSIPLMPKPDSFWDHPIETIEKALDLRKQIEALRAREAKIMGGSSSVDTGAKRRGRPAKAAAVPTAGAKVDGRKGKRSAAARAKMAAAQKARWAAKKPAGAAPADSSDAEPATKSPKKRRTMSPEARARIAAAQRARWAKVKR